MMQKQSTALLTGALIGGGLVYLLDPESGRRRRALLRDQAIHAQHSLADSAGAAARDLRNRSQGIIGEARYRLRGGEVDDVVLAERVRAKIGRSVSHPSSIQVTAEGGVLVLEGSILAWEVEKLLRAVWSVPGVKGVDNRLKEYQDARNIPALQGQPSARRGEQEKPDILQRNWSPATRVLAGGAGVMMFLYGLLSRNILGLPATLLGFGLTLRATTNKELKRLTGIGAGRAAVDLQKTINIDAPLEEVFRLWSSFQNFPNFMSHVKEVRDLGEGQSRWVVEGPIGSRVEWNAEITRYEKNRVLAWKTLPGSTVEHAGIIHFDPNPDGSTRVEVRFTYNPVAGALGHAVAALFRSDPKQQMDEDLLRMKSFIETGQPPSDAAKPMDEATRREEGERIPQPMRAEADGGQFSE